MTEELAYSIHLGSDKNRSKVARKVSKGNSSNTTSFTNNAIQNAQQLSKVNKHNLRDYDNKRDEICVIYGTNNLVDDVKNLFKSEFEEAKEEYNKKQTRSDRVIKNYFEYVSQDKKRDLACELVIELGDMDFWKDKDIDYTHKMIEVYGEQVYDFMKIVPEFKVANAVIHFDETSPHMHMVGIPVKTEYKNGMKKQVGKSKIFTKESLSKIQDEMRKCCVKTFNRVYEEDARLKGKQKGRNQDIKTKDMENYREIKKQREEHTKQLAKVNSKSDSLKYKSDAIYDIVDNLRSPNFNKSNKIISDEDVEKIKVFAEEVKDTTNDIKSVNDLNILIDEYDKNYDKLENENKILNQKTKFQEEKINELNDTISIKDKVINELRSKVEKLENLVYKFKGFWKRIITQFKYRVFDEKTGERNDNSYINVTIDLYNNGVIDDTENEMIQDVRKKVKYVDPDEVQDKNKKINKNDYNLN